jgi:sugar transferase (PEP-CTERM/EpsH1 system associated)
MRDLLFLSHRIPYPPDKGDKIRAWHVLRHLARSHRIHLGCFVDDPADLAHVATLRAVCADLKIVPIRRRWHRLRSLARARPGQPLSLAYFADAGLRAWVAEKVAGGIELAFVHCSAMAPYLLGERRVRRVLDMVDVDSAKWAAYAARAGWPGRLLGGGLLGAGLLWAREARTLLAFERAAARDYDHTLFVSRDEAASFAALAPDSAGRIGWRDNGVDFLAFAPTQAGASPYPAGAPYAVFTGTMDYWPNIDAVSWFADAVLPLIRQRHPTLGFAIVGAHPTQAVRRLGARPGILVTGRVADTRPYLAHAALAVAPLRLARGTQNKVLEALAMARPVVATPDACAGLRAVPGRDLLVGADAASLAAHAGDVLAGRHPGLGAAGRAMVERHYAWDHTLAGLENLFESGGGCDTCSVTHDGVAAEIIR